MNSVQLYSEGSFRCINAYVNLDSVMNELQNKFSYGLQGSKRTRLFYIFEFFTDLSTPREFFAATAKRQLNNYEFFSDSSFLQHFTNLLLISSTKLQILIICLNEQSNFKLHCTYFWSFDTISYDDNLCRRKMQFKLELSPIRNQCLVSIETVDIKRFPLFIQNG